VPGTYFCASLCSFLRLIVVIGLASEHLNMNEVLTFTEPLITGDKTRSDVTNDILNAPKGKSKLWLIAFGVSASLLAIGGYCLYRVWWDGIGMWGENRSINWAWDITNFVWWIGIGHAGTLISAILLLFRAKWRNSINRSAEGMTLCAVTCSGFYIIAHLGRPWLVHWVIPFKNQYGSLWVNFNSPLVWDAFAVLTYILVSFVYWYLGLVPDLATLRDKRTGFRKKIYAIFSIRWQNSSWQWRRYESVMLTLAGLATALVVSVHSIVSMDFATGLIPGWHSTIFPPYFVIGAILSGFAMVLTLLIPLRKLLGLEDYITIGHIEKMNLMVLINSGLIGISYMTELFGGYYSGEEHDIILYRLTGDYAVFFFIMLLCNFFLPQLLYVKRLRRSITFSFVLAIFINIGMWIERFVIIVTSLSHDHLPSSWTLFFPTLFDVGVFIFSVGLFLFSFFLLVRFVPFVNMSEVKQLIKRQ
jgi:Ni/Fe-hydrogenase subunit HybB-like protein